MIKSNEGDIIIEGEPIPVVAEGIGIVCELLRYIFNIEDKKVQDSLLYSFGVTMLNLLKADTLEELNEKIENIYEEDQEDE